RLSPRKIALRADDRALDWIASRGDPRFGARPIRRTLQNEVEAPLAKALLSGKVSDGAQVGLEVGEEGLRLAVV
ncbi:MAG TPA: hypothetical protein PKY05_17525, partial [Fibrobacteria bacterium]|nr:hypothetical protein [Fibrobacteria bacterium]